MLIGRIQQAFRVGLLLSAAVLYSGHSDASMVSYTLNQTNIDQGSLVDGVNYAIVSIDDNTANKISFTVTLLSPLTMISGSNYGLQSFDFNVAGSNPLSSSGNAPAGQWTLPVNWSANVAPPNNQADGFGKFDVGVGDGGTQRQSPLIFSIDSQSTGLTIDSFAALSNGNATQGSVYFAAHIAGFNVPGSGVNQVTSGYFGGSEIAPVPLPAAGWLFLSGLAVLGGMARVNRHRNAYI